MTRYLTLIAAIVFSALISNDANAACHSAFFRFQFGSPASTTVTGNGTPCYQAFNSGSLGAISEVSLAKRPSSGTVDITGIRTRYTPKKGFKGSDAFALKVCGTDRASSGCSVLTYNVTIQ
jgi:hypothetical protein